MRVPLGWLSEWIGLPFPEPGSLDDFLDRITEAGLEVEEVIATGPDFSALRVGHVVERSAHPDADKLSLCRVDVGEGEPLDIVCGAPNVAAGQRVAVALHGTRLPDGTKIKRSRIRGVRSNGMICSVRELGLGDEHEGILELETDAAPGTPLSSVLSGGETVLDLKITPNRGDWVSMLGLAREVKALWGGTLRLPACDVAEITEAAADHVAIEIEDAEGCPRYVARIVRGVRVGPSPAWLVERLEAAGVRSVNNVVDATNLAMLELGQPLHAFDLARLRGGKVRVRAAQAGEGFTTLDGQERALEPADLVIADAEAAIALAGVMGGLESEVTETTVDVLLESAQFHPSRIRRTARRLGLPTDASYRFERGVDPEGVARAADRAARLLAELAGGEVCAGRVEAVGTALPRAGEIALDPGRVERLLGVGLPRAKIVDALRRVDVVVEDSGSGALRCRAPSWRRDLVIPEDLIEEVARIHGYDSIEATVPSGPFLGVSEPADRGLVEALRDGLVQTGATELMTFPGFPEGDLDRLGLAADDDRRAVVRLQNPLQSEQAALRPTLVPTLLRAAQLNLSRQVESLRIFELGRAFRAEKDEELPRESREAAFLVCEARRGGLWDRADVPVFFQAKGVAERVLAGLGVAARFDAGTDEPFLHPGASGCFRAGDAIVARVGDLHPETAAGFEIEAPAALGVFDVDALLRAPRSEGHYRELSRQPRARRDLAVLLDASVPSGDVVEEIRKTAGSNLRSVTLFDRYEGKGVPEGKVSLAFRLEFQRADRTLTDAEVSKSVDRTVARLAERFGGELRRAL